MSLSRFLALPLAALMLAGCGASPLASAGLQRTAGGAAALVDTSRHMKTLVVPADVMAYADDYMARMHAKYDHGDTSAHFGVKLEASADHFKRTFEAAIDRYNPRNAGGNQTFLLDMDAPAGEMEYYLVVTGVVTTENKSGLKMDSLPDFYVSDYGKNYRTTVK